MSLVIISGIVCSVEDLLEMMFLNKLLSHHMLK
jgi:hypothetical protein